MSTTLDSSSKTAPKKVCTICKDPTKELYNTSWCFECKKMKETERRANMTEEQKEEIRKKNREKYKQNKVKAQEKIKQIDQKQKITCTGCKVEKLVVDFYIAKQKGTIRAKCKECTLKEKSEYYEKNKEQYIKQTTKYKNEKAKKDPVYRLERRVRCRIYYAFKSQGKVKTNRTHKYLGCSSEYLLEWLTYQFTPGMTIDNYGTYWHMDHVKPCSAYNLSNDDEIYECFNWKNIRPLEGKENIVKSDKIDIDLIKSHKEIVNKFLNSKKELII